MKKFMLVIIDRYSISKSRTILFESDLSNLEDVLINKLCEVWEINVDEFNLKVEKDECVGVDCEEESYLLIEL